VEQLIDLFRGKSADQALVHQRFRIFRLFPDVFAGYVDDLVADEHQAQALFVRSDDPAKEFRAVGLLDLHPDHAGLDALRRLDDLLEDLLAAEVAADILQVRTEQLSGPVDLVTPEAGKFGEELLPRLEDRKSTRLHSSHVKIS